MQVKLFLLAEGEEADEFLREVERFAKDMKESWNIDNPKAVKSIVAIKFCPWCGARVGFYTQEYPEGDEND